MGDILLAAASEAVSCREKESILLFLMLLANNLPDDLLQAVVTVCSAYLYYVSSEESSTSHSPTFMNAHIKLYSLLFIVRLFIFKFSCLSFASLLKLVTKVSAKMPTGRVICKLKLSAGLAISTQSNLVLILLSCRLRLNYWWI